MPYRSTLWIKGIHAYVNVVFVALQKVLPSGAGHCIALKREVFQQSPGFDSNLKVGEDVALGPKAVQGTPIRPRRQAGFCLGPEIQRRRRAADANEDTALSIMFAFGKFGEQTSSSTSSAVTHNERLKIVCATSAGWRGSRLAVGRGRGDV